MLSLDTNIVFYALNADAPLNEEAVTFLDSLRNDEEVAISEFMLAELYRLLRNPVVVSRPLSAPHAVEIVQHFRHHPRWKVIGFPMDGRGMHDRLWAMAAAREFAYRRLFDARLALLLIEQGVTEFATVNTRDFEGLGFDRVWNPLA